MIAKSRCGGIVARWRGRPDEQPKEKMITTEHTKKELKTEQAWAVVNERGSVFYYTISDHRVCAVMEHVEMQRKTWKELREMGDRAVKITITVVG